jgi:hypothetical protein
MVNSNNGNDDTSKGKDADKVGKLSDGLLRLVDETDKDGYICYCVETVAGMNWSIDSKGDTKSRKPKADDNNDNGDKSATPKTVDPAKVQRKRMAI